MYPFDRPEFEYRFELSHFELDVTGKVETYRFDFYRQRDNEISWRGFTNFVPEFEMDYLSAKFVTVVEHKPGKEKPGGEIG